MFGESEFCGEFLGDILSADLGCGCMFPRFCFLLCPPHLVDPHHLDHAGHCVEDQHLHICP